MFSTVRGMVSRPSVATSCSSNQSSAVRTMVFPTPAPWRSGRTARGPIHPSVPERWAMLKATTWPASSRHSIAPVQAPGLVERAEDLVQHEQRQRLARPLGNHLRDREPQHETRNVLLAARDDRLRDAALEDRERVVFRQLELVVAAVGQVGEEAGGELGDLGAHARVQLAPQVRERAVQLVVKALARLEAGDLALALSPLRLPSLRLCQVVFGAVQLAAGLDDRELGLAQGTHRPIEAILRPPVLGVREALRTDRLGQLPHPTLAGRELLLRLHRLFHEALRAPGALLQSGRLERDGLEFRELGSHGVVSRRVVAGRPCGELALELARPPPRAGELRARAG